MCFLETDEKGKIIIMNEIHDNYNEYQWIFFKHTWEENGTSLANISACKQNTHRTIQCEVQNDFITSNIPLVWDLNEPNCDPVHSEYNPKAC